MEEIEGCRETKRKKVRKDKAIEMRKVMLKCKEKE